MQYFVRLLSLLALILVSTQAASPLYIEHFSLTNRSLELKAFNNAGDLLVMMKDPADPSSFASSIPALVRSGSIILLQPVGAPEVDSVVANGMSELREDGGLYIAGTAFMSDGFWRAALWNLSTDGTFTFRTMPNIFLPEDSSAPGEQRRSFGVAVNRSGVLVGSGESYLAGLATIWYPPYAQAQQRLLSTGSSYDAISDAGLLLANGVEFDHGNANNRYSAAVLTAAGNPQEIPLLERVDNWLYPSQAYSMRGEWVCGYNHTRDGSRGFAWKIGSAASIDLPNPPELDGEANNRTEVLSINSSGHAVGYMNGGDYSMRPILWRLDNGSYIPYFFEDLLPGEEYASHIAEANSLQVNDREEIAFVKRDWKSSTLKVYKRLTDGVVEFVMEGASGEEESGKAEFKVRLFRASENTGPVTVHFQTSDDTAVSPRDYTALQSSITWQPWESGEKTITVLLHDNLTIDQSRVFKIQLTSVTGAQLGSRREATCYISEEWQQFEVRNQMQVGWNYGCAVLRGQPQVVLKIERSGGTDGAITFTNFQTSDLNARAGEDFQLPPNLNISWAAGESGIRTIIIPLLNADQPIEEARTFSISATGKYEGSEMDQYLMAQVIILAKPEEAPPSIDANAIQKLLDSFSMSISVMQGALVELEQSLGGLDSGWTKAAEARSEDGEVELTAPITTGHSHRFFRIKVRQD